MLALVQTACLVAPLPLGSRASADFLRVRQRVCHTRGAMTVKILLSLVVGVTLWSMGAVARAQEPAAGLPPTQAPAHADCGHRMPLWEHRLATGEHLSELAVRYGVSVAELVRLNQLKRPDLVREGQTIRVCPTIYPHVRKQVQHVVEAGDTLGGIAARHHLSLRALQRAMVKPLASDVIFAGQVLTFEVDGGLAPAFLPPPPKPPARGKRGGVGSRKAVAMVQLSHVPGTLLRRPQAAFGTRKTIESVQAAVTRYRAQVHAAPHVVIGDISRPGGGAFRPHVSHRHGRDVDVGYVLVGVHSSKGRPRDADAGSIDVARTWALLRAFLATQEVDVIFVDRSIQKLLVNYLARQGMASSELARVFQVAATSGRPTIRHWPGHTNHFHVRFLS